MYDHPYSLIDDNIDDEYNVYAQSPGLPPPVFSSDDEDLPSSDHDPPDIDPNDQDYINKVEQHIFSPEVAEKTKEVPTVHVEDSNQSSISEVTITSTEVTDLDNINGSSNHQRMLDDPEITPTHNAVNTLSFDEDTLPVPPVESEEYSPIDVGSELYNLDKTLEEEGEDEESYDEGEEDGDDTSYNGSKFDSEEGSSRTDDSNVEWIKCINVFEYRLSKNDLIGSGSSGSGRGGGGAVPSDDELMTYGMLINDLEVLLA